MSKFFSAVPNSVKGVVNAQELARAVLGAGVASSLVGVLVAVLSAVSADASAIFPRPGVAAFAVFGIAQVLELLRRKAHGGPALAPARRLMPGELRELYAARKAPPTPAPLEDGFAPDPAFEAQVRKAIGPRVNSPAAFRTLDEAERFLKARAAREELAG